MSVKSVGVILAIVAAIAVAAALVSSALMASAVIPYTGTVITTVDIGVYLDSGCTTPMVSVVSENDKIFKLKPVHRSESPILNSLLCQSSTLVVA